jgi:hypothetical protein
MLALSLICQQTPEICCQSAFPKFKAYLFGSSDLQEALAAILGKARMTKYHDLIDCIYCEVFPSHRPLCFAFYNGKGPQLIDILPENKIRIAEVVLIRVAATALVMHSLGQKADWSDLVAECIEFFK